MKKLHTKEWIAIIIAVFVVGFFFIFGQSLLTAFTNATSGTNQNNMNTGLGIKDTVIGMGDEAVVGTRVTVHYTGHLTDVNGKVFDSSVARNEPFQFVLGAGQVIEGWDKGIVGMKIGGSRVLTIPPTMGYGMQDYGPIPGGSTLVFEVQLLKVEK